MGGGLMLIAGLLLGQGEQIHLDRVSWLSLISVAYLVLFGSLIGFTAYVWLLKVTTPARVSTYAFVNPVVAVFLGWVLAGEQLSWRVLIAAAVIILGVILITFKQAAVRSRSVTAEKVVEAAQPSLAEGA